MLQRTDENYENQLNLAGGAEKAVPPQRDAPPLGGHMDRKSDGQHGNLPAGTDITVIEWLSKPSTGV